MRKTMVIAGREFSAAVKSKAFLISLILMPLMMFGGIFVQRMAAKMGDTKTKRIAIVDRSGDPTLFDDLASAAAQRNSSAIFDKKTGKQVRPKIELERVEPAALDDEAKLKAQRYELSERVRNNELFAFAELGPDILKPKFAPTTRAAEIQEKGTADLSFVKKMDLSDEMIGENNGVRYATNRPTNVDVRDFLQSRIAHLVLVRRASLAGVPVDRVPPLAVPAKVINHGLTKRDASGAITDSTRENEVMAFLIPLALLMLMFLIVMVGASPMTTNLVEEKQLRIAEVLLGSVRPFELMMGKLLGGVGVALTLAAIYFIGVYVVARQMNLADVVSARVIVWFLVFTVLGTMMYGAMFVAAGAAVTNVKEAQSMLTPVILLIILPTFILESLLRDPSGGLATFASFFPTSAPMVTVARIAIPPGIPMWQTIGSALVTLLTTAAIIWAAGRVFRVGILMQGQGAKIGEMMKWIVRG